jgi:hypothetical protein
MISVRINDNPYRAAERFTIRSTSGSMSTSSVDVLIGDNTIPQALQPVQIFDGETAIFFGYIESAESPVFSTALEPKRWRLNIYSGEKVFDFRLVNDAWQEKYTHEIVADIFTDYIETEGITLGEISVLDYFYETYTSSYQKVSQVLEELAQLVDAQYFISEDKKFYFLKRDAISIVDAPEHITALQKSQTAIDVRTVQTVLGASEETSNQTENFVWVTDQKTATLGYQVSSVSGITINGTPVEYGVRGIDEADTDVSFLYEFGSQIITVNDNATTKPANTDNVVIVYKGYYDIIVVTENEQLKEQIATLNGTSGRIEYVETDETIDNYLDAQAKADALLAQYGEMESEITCKLDSTDYTSLLTGWRFAYPELGVAGDYVIVERTIEDFGPDKLRVSLKMKNKGFFSRYGTVFKRRDKKEKRVVVVYKSSLFGDNLSLVDVPVFELGGMVYYPTSGLFTDPELDGFFPVWG